MNKKNIAPNPQQPVDRKPTGKLPEALAELSEAGLSHSDAANAAWVGDWYTCSYDGDDAANAAWVGDWYTCSYDGDND